MGGRRWKPKLRVPVGIAAGLVVLWYIQPLLMPWVAENPIARALIAVGLSALGAVIAYVVLVVVTRSWPGARRADRR